MANAPRAYQHSPPLPSDEDEGWNADCGMRISAGSQPEWRPNPLAACSRERQRAERGIHSLALVATTTAAQA